MKKLMVSMVAGVVLMLSLSSFALAATADKDPEKAAIRAELQSSREELKGLREEAQGIRTDISTERETIKGQIADLKESGNKEMLKAAKTYREQLKALNEEIRTIREARKQLWEEFKSARAAKDVETAKAKFAQLIETKKTVIEKLNAKLSLLEQLSAAL